MLNEDSKQSALRMLSTASSKLDTIHALALIWVDENGSVVSHKSGWKVCLLGAFQTELDEIRQDLKDSSTEYNMDEGD